MTTPGSQDYPASHPRRGSFFQSLLLTIACISGVLSLALFFAPQAPVPITVSQGDKVIINDNFTCTVGYVDAATRRAFIAAHCSNFATADNIRANTTLRTDIGTLVVNERITKHTQGSGDIVDIAVIELDDHVRIGTNSYSGNQIADINTLTAQDKLCRVDVIDGEGVRCSHPTMRSEHYIAADDAIIVQGDSGGPMWVEGPGGEQRGLIGIIAGFTDDDSPNANLDIASVFDPAIWLRQPLQTPTQNTKAHHHVKSTTISPGNSRTNTSPTPRPRDKPNRRSSVIYHTQHRPVQIHGRARYANHPSGVTRQAHQKRSPQLLHHQRRR